MTTTSARITWCTAREAGRVIVYRSHLSRTMLTALVVGTILFAINHLDTVLRGAATAETWVKIAITYLVPFCVANIGVLLGCRRPPGPE
ncbi:MAG: nitrate/nitrite transporter NrtS [Nocardioidaceae bacterium]